MNLGPEVGERLTQSVVEHAHPGLVGCSAGLGGVVDEVVGEQFVEQGEIALALDLFGVAADHRLCGFGVALGSATDASGLSGLFTDCLPLYRHRSHRPGLLRLGSLTHHRQTQILPSAAYRRPHRHPSGAQPFRRRRPTSVRPTPPNSRVSPPIPRTTNLCREAPSAPFSVRLWEPSGGSSGPVSDRRRVAGCACRAGDRYAFEELFLIAITALYRLAMLTSRNADDAADALQDALLSAHRGRGLVPPDAAAAAGCTASW